MTIRAGTTVQLPTATQRAGLGGTQYAVDPAGRRTIGWGIVLDPLPTVPEVFMYQAWSPERGTETVALAPGLVFRVRTWDVDEQAEVEDSYPAAFVWENASVTPFGACAVSAYDGDAPTPELAALFDAERYAR